MLFDGLVVIHRLKSSVPAVAHGAPLLPQECYSLDSCQRTLWAFVSMDGFSSLFYGSDEGLQFARNQGLLVYQGMAAYAFLLKVATGLESQMVGETEVLGQVKRSWQCCLATKSAQAKALQPIFQKLFEDAKRVRSQYLQKLGSCSYGSLVRKLLNQHAAQGTAAAAVLLVGAGQFAESVLPWLSQYQVLLCNRTREKAEVLAARFVGLQSIAVFSDADTACWESAQHLILCVPGGSAGLEARVRAWRATHPQGLVLDLGEPAVCGQTDVAAQRPLLTVTLQDLFILRQQEQSDRNTEVEKARLACDDAAQERELNATVTFPFGWDDLWAYG